MKEQRLNKNVEEHARKFKLRAHISPNDGKRHDQVRPDEGKWMGIAHNQLGWSLAKVGGVFNRNSRTVTKALRNLEQKEQVERQTNLHDPLIIEATRMHFSDLKELIKEWQWEIGSGLEPPTKWFKMVFFDESEPTNPEMLDSAGSRKNQLGSQTDREKVVIRFPAENEVLFECLRNHLPNEKLWQSFEDLKLLLSERTKPTASPQEDSALVKRITAIACTIYQELELELVKHVFPGKCMACPQY